MSAFGTVGPGRWKAVSKFKDLTLNLLTMAAASAGSPQTAFGGQLSFDTIRAAQQQDQQGRKRSKRAQVDPSTVHRPSCT